MHHPCIQVQIKTDLIQLYPHQSCFFVVYTSSPNSMSKTFGRSFRINKSNSILTMKTFSCWDFKVIKKKSVQIMSENIGTQLKVSMQTNTMLVHIVDADWQECADLKHSLWSVSLPHTIILLPPHQELLAELTQKHTKSTFCKTLCRLMVHGVAWTICIASTTGCMAGVYYFSKFIHKVRLDGLSSPVCHKVFVPYVSLNRELVNTGCTSCISHRLVTRCMFSASQ